VKNKLQILNSDNQGRFSTALHAFPKKSEILTGNPYAYAFTKRFASHICAWTLEVFDKPLQIYCSHCKEVYYESEENRANGFAYHHQECRAFQKIHAYPLNSSYKMLMKTLCRAVIRKAWEQGLSKQTQIQKCNKTQLKYLEIIEVPPTWDKNLKWKHFESLVSNRDQYGILRFNARKRLAERLVKAMPALILEYAFPKSDAEDIIDQLAEAICRYECNCFGYFSPKGDQTGAAVIPGISFINHSCAPNSDSIFYFPGGSITIQALRDIPEGEEITITYCDLSLNKKDRQKYLKHNYFFDCQCLRCVPPKKLK